MFSASWLLFASTCLGALVSAYEPLSSSFLYEVGFYGLYATSSFKSFDLKTPLLNFPRWDEELCGDGYYVLAQKGKLVSKPGPTILDTRGQLVWADANFGVVFNLQVQTYRGEDYLTFWASPKGSSHGYGKGTYYMLDSSYRVFRKFEARGDGVWGDLHEFTITDQDTVMITIYNPVPADLSSMGGPEEGWVLDCRFQEIDIETGSLVFEWSALEHVAIDDTLLFLKDEDNGASPDSAFDFFHINSLDKDGEGNYIVSSRHLSSILCVSPAGDLLWTLSGTQNDFTDLSDGRATDFMYQHHVRLHDNNTLSVFDNALSERTGPASTVSHSRGLLLQLDVENMTVRLLHEYWDPDSQKLPSSQGSMQLLPDDDRVVLSYGWLPYITEFASSDGSVVCDVELAPWIAARWGLVTTYRAFKTKRWIGRPDSLPSVYYDPPDGRIFVSWNGATEVDRWVLEGAEWEGLDASGGGGDEDDVKREDGFVGLGEIKKERFEESFDVDDTMPGYLRVVALDRHGHVLKRSAVVNRLVGNAPSRLVQNILIGVCVCIVSIVAVVMVLWRKGVNGVKRDAMRAIHSAGTFVSAVRDRLLPTSNGKAKVTSGAALDFWDLRRWSADGDGGVLSWWRDWKDAKPHELESLRAADSDSIKQR